MRCRVSSRTSCSFTRLGKQLDIGFSDIVISDLVKSETVLLALQRATHATSKRLSSELDDLGLSPAELNVMAILSDGAPRRASDLAAEAGVRPSTMTNLVDRLQKRGYTGRGAPDLGDRRVVWVFLNDLGKIAAERIRRAIADLEKQALGGVSKSAVAGFHEVLRALTEAAE